MCTFVSHLNINFPPIMATTIVQILENEQENTDRIHLYREGLFLKAYQRSAFQFHTHVKPFRAVKKFYKSTDCNVVMLGFPSSNLERVFPDGNYEQAEDGHIVVACPPLDERAYEAWFGIVEMVPEKQVRRKGGSNPQTHIPPVSPVPADEFEFAEVAALPSVRVYDRDSVADAVAHRSDAGANYGGMAGDRVLRELEVFPIENSTPMECMLFLSKLKSELKKGTSGGI